MKLVQYLILFVLLWDCLPSEITGFKKPIRKLIMTPQVYHSGMNATDSTPTIGSSTIGSPTIDATSSVTLIKKKKKRKSKPTNKLLKRRVLNWGFMIKAFVVTMFDPSFGGRLNTDKVRCNTIHDSKFVHWNVTQHLFSILFLNFICFFLRVKKGPSVSFFGSGLGGSGSTFGPVCGPNGCS